ncbi:MAG: hypothetical protein P4L31_04785 [Candidatus Babeliales bacterium]|nr:hypothetical protein [Candidatus Babeliales bacterium]
MKKLLLGSMLACTLMCTPAGYAMNTFNPMASTASTWSPAVKMSAGILAGITGYTIGKYLYAKYTAYVNNQIINETVDALYLSITLNNTIEKLPQSEREQAFRNKARYINIRKRVIAQLEDIAKQKSLSQEHHIALDNRLNRISFLFKCVDGMRNQNPYEDEYSVASRFDKIIEKNIINSIILNLKPDNECTQEEFTKKQALADRRSIISDKLQERISKNIQIVVDKYGIYIRIAKLILF